MSMVSCPKCGFTQPTDQYCAKCGIDMQSYQPAEKPLYLRILSDTVFQLVTVTVVIGIGFLAVRETRRAALAKRVAEIDVAREAELSDERIAKRIAPPPIAPSKKESSSISPPPVAQVSTVAVGAAVGAAPGVAAPTPTAPTSGVSPASVPSGALAVAASSTTTTAGASATNAPPNSVRVAFYEVRRSALSALTAEAKQAALDGSPGYAVITNIESKLKSDGGGMHNNDATSPQPLKLNQPALFFKGGRDETTGANLGFTIQVIPTSIEENSVRVQVDIQRILRDSGGSGLEDETFPMPDNIVLEKGSALVLINVLPHRSFSETDERFYKSIGALKSLASEEYKSGASTALIIIEAK